jgi:hypothetical protein
MEVMESQAEIYKKILLWRADQIGPVTQSGIKAVGSRSKESEPVGSHPKTWEEIENQESSRRTTT